MSEIKVVEEQKYSGKFKVGDEVKVIAVTKFKHFWRSNLNNVRKRGFVTKVSNFTNLTSYPYQVELEDGLLEWFNEAELELAKNSNEIKHNDDSFDSLQHAAKKIGITDDELMEMSTILSNATKSMLPNRPASSHYHVDNNGNDVWKFSDDNLSDERVKGFHQINAIKYVSRYNKKQDTAEKRIEDLEKAKVSIDELIRLEKE